MHDGADDPNFELLSLTSVVLKEGRKTRLLLVHPVKDNDQNIIGILLSVEAVGVVVLSLQSDK